MTSPTSSRLIHVWANPPDTPFPLTASPVRIAVGTPHARSSNSWRLWVQGDDIYVACRDNFREFKVSLHASGIWRLGLTEQFMKGRPDIVAPGQDRAWKKWRPTLDSSNRLVIGFQVVVHHSSLYLNPDQRTKWPREVIFAEQTGLESELTVLSVCVVLGHQPIIFAPGTLGAVVAVVPVGQRRTVQLVVTYEDGGDFESVIADGFRRAVLDLKRRKVDIPEGGVFLVHGNRGNNNVPYISAVPFSRLAPSSNA